MGSLRSVTLWPVGLCAGLLVSSAVAAPLHASDPHLPLEAVHLLMLPGIDLDAIADEDLRRDDKGLPLRIAIGNDVSITTLSHGTWEKLNNGKLMWRLRVFSENAAHLNFGFDQFNLPRSASMELYSLDGENVVGPLHASDAGPKGAYWTRIIPSDEVIIEVTIDAADRAALEDGMHLASIAEGYRGLGTPPSRGESESCNIDVICPEGDAWANEISSVGVYTVQGTWTCSGFMVNNTAGDERPLFMTADHCGINNGNDQSVVVYWNHQNSYCRTPGSGDSGGSGDGSFSQYTSGCNFLASDNFSDTTLVVMNSSPDPSWNISFAGWSRANSAANGAGIHHPECAEKRISFPDVTSNEGQYWRVNWRDGRTAQGSSGSPLFDANHRAIGNLCCGTAYCWNDEDDYYGRGFAEAWSDLSPHLDPLGQDPTGIDTFVPSGGTTPQGACCFGGECTYVTAQECAAVGGTYLGDYVPCAGNPCEPNNGASCQSAKPASTGANPFDTSSSVDSGFGDPDESQCEGTFLDWDGSPDFWFKWTAPGTGTLDLDTCDAISYDTSMIVYEGSACEELVQIACNGDAEDDDNECQNYFSMITGITVTSGQLYWVRLGGWQAATGAGTLNITYNGTVDPTGGCCHGITCAIYTAIQCDTLGGTYLGDGSDCVDDPCATPEIGACCLSGNCTVATVEDCEQVIGGTFLGDGTDCTDNPCDGGTGDNVSVHWSIVGTDLLSTGESCYTVDVFADIPTDWRVDAVAGNSLQQKTVATTTSFFQSAYGGPTSTEVNPDFYPLAEDLQWDSRVTIGCIDSSGNPFDENGLNSIGINWAEFESGGNLSVGDGTWFCLPTDAQGLSRGYIDSGCGQRNGVLVARLTTMDLTSEILFEALFQGRDTDNLTWQETASALVTYQGEQDCNSNRVPDACDISNGTSDDINGNGIPDECESSCNWDITGDGQTNIDDLLALIAHFPATYDVNDLLALLAEFGCGG